MCDKYIFLNYEYCEYCNATLYHASLLYHSTIVQTDENNIWTNVNSREGIRLTAEWISSIIFVRDVQIDGHVTGMYVYTFAVSSFHFYQHSNLFFPLNHFFFFFFSNFYFLFLIEIMNCIIKSYVKNNKVEMTIVKICNINKNLEMKLKLKLKTKTKS